MVCVGWWQLAALNLLERVHTQFGAKSSGTTVCATAATAELMLSVIDVAGAGEGAEGQM